MGLRYCEVCCLISTPISPTNTTLVTKSKEHLKKMVVALLSGTPFAKSPAKLLMVVPETLHVTPTIEFPRILRFSSSLVQKPIGSLSPGLVSFP